MAPRLGKSYGCRWPPPLKRHTLRMQATGLRLTKILTVVPTVGSAADAMPDFEWPSSRSRSLRPAKWVRIVFGAACGDAHGTNCLSFALGGRRSTMKWTLLAAGIYTVVLLIMAERQASAGIELLTKSIMRSGDYTLLKRASLQSP
jgi:hypothetical protein